MGTFSHKTSGQPLRSIPLLTTFCLILGGVKKGICFEGAANFINPDPNDGYPACAEAGDYTNWSYNYSEDKCYHFRDLNNVSIVEKVECDSGFVGCYHHMFGK
jgi:hypothetical protein